MRRAEPIPADITKRLGIAENNGHTPPTITAAELLSETLPPINWVIPDILPEGVHFLAGRPKLGKSWLALGLGIAVANGGVALGTLPVQWGEALYLALEDNRRRLQRRLTKLLPDGTRPEGLHLSTTWARADEGGADDLNRWLTEHPDTRLVIIDTLARIKPRAGGRRSQYDEDRDAVDPLIPIAAEHGVAILVVHHLREGEAEDPLDMIHGSAGLTGGVDGALVLKRRRGDADAYLHFDGRDLENPGELALRWNPDAATWTIMGDADEHRMSEGRRVILHILEDADEPMGPKEIAALVAEKRPGTAYGAVREMLSQMVKDGQVKNLGRGSYTIDDLQKHADNTDNLTNEETF